MLAKVRFQVTAGLYNELLNYLLENEIYIFDLLYNSFGFTATCYAQDYKYIARKSRKFQTRTKIIKKSGLYFRYRHLLERKGLFIGILLFYLITYIFSNIVWIIDIKTSDQLSENSVAVQLYSYGIYPGKFYSEDKFKDIQKSMLSTNEISYISMNFYKGVLQCEITPLNKKEDYISDMRDGDIYSGLSGIISDLRIYNGYSQVELGQSVSRGDILVSSVYIDKHNNIYTSPVRAYIEAVCEKKYSITIPFEKNTQILTGKKYTEVSVNFMGKPMVIKKADINNEENYLKKAEMKYSSILGFHIPAVTLVTHYYELDNIMINQDAISARNIAKLQIEHMIENDEKLKEEISRQYEYLLYDEGLQVNCYLKGYYEIT